MDNLTATLVTQLLEKALENTLPGERLAFIEKLFCQLPPEGQQEFLLTLTGTLLETTGNPTAVPFTIKSAGPGQHLVQFIPATPEDFAPGQICCQALSGFARQPDMDESQVVDIAQKFNGLADETRVKIVKLLAKTEFTVDELVEFLGVPQSTTSHHLRVLREANLIKGDKRGRNTYYSLVKPGQVAVEAM